MWGSARFTVGGLLVLLALAGCGRSFLSSGERASWRHDAEVSCMKSGQVKIGAGVEQMKPIEGPGVCGADFPLKVALLGENSSALGYGDDLRPPGNIPGAAQPNWPPSEDRYYSRTAPPQPVQQAPIQNGNMRWVPGPPGVERRYEQQAPARYEPEEDERYEQQRPPARSQDRYAPERYQAQPRSRYEPDDRYPSRAHTAPPPDNRYMSAPQTVPADRPMSIYAPGVRQPDDIPDDAVLPPGRARPTYQQPSYNAPVTEPQRRAPPALGPARPNMMAAATPAAVTPAATLACPLVSALDKWVSTGVQPAAIRWFGAPVSEIKQISAYSCREMVGSGSSSISEHAFGNALDIAAFILADGRKITVQDGWHGAPEAQGFLRDVHLAACENFSTVLAPGYNAAHYNHIHVDLMRRSSDNRPCRPEAMTGEMAAAKARSMYAVKQRGPAYTGSIPAKADKKSPIAIPGQDGLGEEDDIVTGSIAKARRASGTVNHDYDADEPKRDWPRTVHKAPVPPVEDRMIFH
jgi:hypothetical protein